MELSFPGTKVPQGGTSLDCQQYYNVWSALQVWFGWQQELSSPGTKVPATIRTIPALHCNTVGNPGWQVVDKDQEEEWSQHCGTPLSTSTQAENGPITQTIIFISLKKAWIQVVLTGFSSDEMDKISVICQANPDNCHLLTALIIQQSSATYRIQCGSTVDQLK